MRSGLGKFLYHQSCHWDRIESDLKLYQCLYISLKGTMAKLGIPLVSYLGKSAPSSPKQSSFKVKSHNSYSLVSKREPGIRRYTIILVMGNIFKDPTVGWHSSHTTIILLHFSLIDLLSSLEFAKSISAWNVLPPSLTPSFYRGVQLKHHLLREAFSEKLSRLPYSSYLLPYSRSSPNSGLKW